MKKIIWNASFSVNVSEIDNQHQKLVEIINELNDAISVRKSQELLRKIVSSLISYTETHFKIEEKYFKQYG